MTEKVNPDGNTQFKHANTKGAAESSFPDLNKKPVVIETIKGIGIGAFVGAVIFGVINGYHIIKGEKAFNKYTDAPLTKNEHWREFIKLVGTGASVFGFANWDEIRAENRTKENIKPYVELLEKQRKELLIIQTKFDGK